MSGRAVEAAGDVNTLLLDKTGTITLGNRQAAEFLHVHGVEGNDLADAAQLASLADETPEGRSIVVLAKTAYGLRERQPRELTAATFVMFTAQTRMSGVDLDGDQKGRQIRKGAAAAAMKWVRDKGGHPTDEVGAIVDAAPSASSASHALTCWRSTWRWTRRREAELPLPGAHVLTPVRDRSVIG